MNILSVFYQGFQIINLCTWSQRRMLHSTYSKDEQDNILHYINNLQLPQNTRPKLPASIKKIVEFRQKNGPITDLNMLLEVKGISTKPALNLCNAILKALRNSQDPQTFKYQCASAANGKSNNPKPSKIIQPNLKKCPMKFAAVDISAHCISWAVLECKQTWKNQSLLSWNFHKFSNNHLRKTDLVHEIVCLKSVLPKQKVYVLKNHNLERKRSSALNDQLYGIVLSLLSSNIDLGSDAEENIFLMKSEAPGQLFDLIIGNETISVQSYITDILQSKSDINGSVPKLQLSLRQICFEDNSIGHYLRQDVFHKEAMSKSLILAKAFVEIILHSFPV